MKKAAEHSEQECRGNAGNTSAAATTSGIGWSFVAGSDRRRARRTRICGQAMAVFSDGVSAGRVTSVTLVDAGEGGLGVLCPFKVEAGSSFSLTPDVGPFPRRVGIVAHCKAVGGEFRLGLRSKSKAAAA